MQLNEYTAQRRPAKKRNFGLKQPKETKPHIPIFYLKRSIYDEKTWKTPVALLLTLLMLLGAMPLFTFAANDTIQYAYDADTKTLTITGTGAMDDYAVSDPSRIGTVIPWYNEAKDAEKIVIAENITKIGAFSFVLMTKLQEVVLPSTLTEIGAYAFLYDFALETINLPDSITVIGESAFAANSLSNLTLPAGLVTLEENFVYNFKPMKVTLNSGLQTVRSCFEDSYVEELTIPASVTSISGCDMKNLKTLVNNSATAVVSDCISSIADPEYVDVLLKYRQLEMQLNINYMFNGVEPTEDEINALIAETCSYAAQAHGLSFENEQEMYAFMEQSLQEIAAPRSDIELYCLSDSAEHDMLHEIAVPHYFIDQDNALCTLPLVGKAGDNLTWTVDENTKTLAITGYGEMYDDYTGFQFYQNSIEHVTFTATDGNAITYIGSRAFSGLTKLEALAIPEGVTSIGANFLDGSGVKTLQLPATYTNSKGASLAYVFASETPALEAITVANGNQKFFSYNGGLYLTDRNAVELIKLPLSAQSQPLYSSTTLLGERMLDSGTLASFTIPAGVTGVRAQAFYRLNSLTGVVIETGAQALQIGTGAFYYCPNFAAFTVAADDTRFTVVDGVLYNKAVTRLVAVPYAVTNLTLPQTVTGIANNEYANWPYNETFMQTLTVLNDEFNFSNYQSVLNIRSKKTTIRANSASSAEAFATREGYAFEALDGVTIDHVTFDFSAFLPATVERFTYVDFYSKFPTTATVYYSNGTTRAVPSNEISVRYYDASGGYHYSATFNTPGDYTLTAVYGNFSDTFTLTVTQGEIDSYYFTLPDQPVQIEQYTMLTRNSFGVKLFAKYTDPDRPDEEVSLDGVNFLYRDTAQGEGEAWHWVFDDPFSNKLGTYEVQLSYKDAYRATVMVEVVPGMTIDFNFDNALLQAPLYSTYTLSNWGVTATLTKNGNTYDVTEYLHFIAWNPRGGGSYDSYQIAENQGFEVEPRIYMSNVQLGDETVSVEASFDRFNVSVVQGDVSSIRIDLSALPETLNVGQVYWLRDYVKVYRVFADNTEEEIEEPTLVIYGVTQDGEYFADSYLCPQIDGEQFTFRFVYGGQYGEVSATKTMTAYGVHTIVPVAGTPSTCEVPGTIDHYECETCHKLYSDAAGENEITDISAPLGDHVFGDWVPETAATCNATGEKGHYTCTVCHKNFDENEAEIADLTIQKDKTNHVGDEELRNVKAATCKEDGYTGDICCSACGDVLTPGSAISKSTVPHTARKTDAKNATCDAAGNIEYYTCSVCNKLFKDAACTQETNAAGVTIPKKNHAWGAWTTVRNATCTQEGLEQRVCANDSSHKETRPIAKTAHVDNGNGYCKNCGADLKGGDRCKCGEIHTGPFAWLIKFFHTIVYFFKNLGK